MKVTAFNPARCKPYHFCRLLSGVIRDPMVDAIQGETSYTVFKLKGCQKEVGVNLQFVCLRV